MARVPADVRREQFIAAATSVITEHGVEGATTRRIAEAAGAPLASLHYCFHTKEELLWAIWEQQVLAIKERTSDDVAPPVGLGRAAASELRAVVNWMLEEEELVVATTELLLWARRQDPAMGIKGYERHFENGVARLRHNLLKGDDADLIEPLARLIAATVDGLMLQWMTFHDRARLEQDLSLSEEAIEHLVAAHARPAGRARGRSA